MNKKPNALRVVAPNLSLQNLSLGADASVHTSLYLEKHSKLLTFVGSLCLLGLSACGGSETRVQDVPAKTSGYDWRLPARFPVPKVPKDNPMSEAKVELGRHLFYDKRLSVNGTQSCASCHRQDKAFTDGKARAMGATKQQHPRSSQSLVNVAYSPTLNWATPSVTSLEQQMIIPLFGTEPVELGLSDALMPKLIATLKQDATYQTLFAAAYPKLDVQKRVSLATITHAIASFERSIISADSRYDRWLDGKATLSAQEKRGMTLFFGEKAECFHCHGSFNFNDQIVHANTRVLETPFHNTGLYNLDGKGSYPANNNGVFDTTQDPKDKGKFRAPSLRNVAVTAPYNHDGSTKTLHDVLANYAAGGRVITQGSLAGDGRFNPNKDDFIVRIDLTQSEQDDIVAFLETLTDETLLTNPRFSNPFNQQPAGAGTPSK